MSDSYKEGDLVMLSPESQYARSSGPRTSNPLNMFGTVIQSDAGDSDLPTVVDWPNGKTNSYDDQDLIDAKPLLLDLVIQAGITGAEVEAHRLLKLLEPANEKE